MIDPVLIQLLGYFSGLFGTFSTIPQIYRVMITKSTDDLSYMFMYLNNLGAFLWTVYGFLVDDWPLILWDIITIILYTTLICQKYYYANIHKYKYKDKLDSSDQQYLNRPIDIKININPDSNITN